MRSGLEKPGAIPFLALIAFVLLSLVPSSGYTGYYRSDARRMFFSVLLFLLGGLCADGTEWIGTNISPVDSRIRVRATTTTNTGLCCPWLLSEDHSYQPHYPRHVEISSVPPDGRGPSIYPWENSSTLTRGVRAFTTYVFQQLDDHQLLPSFSSRSSSPIETAPLHTTTNSADFSIPHLSSSRDDFPRTIHNSDYTTSTTNKTNKSPDLQFCDRFSDLRQRVCHVASDLYLKVQALSATYDHVMESSLCSASEPDSSSSLAPTNAPHQLDQPSKVSQQTLLPNDSTLASNLPKSMSPPALVPEDSQDAAVGRDPKQLRGSCMAIVIGLVVGVMWFWNLLLDSGLEFGLNIWSCLNFTYIMMIYDTCLSVFNNFAEPLFFNLLWIILYENVLLTKYVWHYLVSCLSRVNFQYLAFHIQNKI